MFDLQTNEWLSLDLEKYFLNTSIDMHLQKLCNQYFIAKYLMGGLSQFHHN